MRISMNFLLVCVLCACATPPTAHPPSPLTSSILNTDEINRSDWLKVDDGLIVSDRADCLPQNCAFGIWDVFQPESLGFTSPDTSLELVISLRSFQSMEEADSQFEIESGQYAGQPGKQWLEIPATILPDHSVAYAEDGRYVVLYTVDGNTLIVVTLSSFNWGINEAEKAASLLANLAKLQIDKLRLSNQATIVC
ncbi:MAG TPA: hypothetical protein PKL78_05660 [Anaerolineales bacterium]|nr:hypothetical protein [Anaerolineales bacterium]